MAATIKAAGSWIIVRGVLALLFGIFALVNPEDASRLFITLFAIYLLIDGLVNAVAALANYGSEGYGFMLAVGVLELAVAVGTFLRPDITATVLALLIGFWALFRGVIELVAGIGLRRELEGEWTLILSGIVSLVFGVAFLLLPFTESTAAIWLVGIYAVLYGTLEIIMGWATRHWVDEIVQVVQEQEAAQRGAPTN